jgi:uncharacterized glyoxalase superfamily protein PhnB
MQIRVKSPRIGHRGLKTTLARKRRDAWDLRRPFTIHLIASDAYWEPKLPKKPTSNPSQFIQAAPLLNVDDLPETIAFYTEQLEFTCDFESENYAVVWRDNAAIHFRSSSQKVSLSAIFLWVKNVDQYYQSLKERSVSIKIELDTRPYGIRDFAVVDISGHELIFGQDAY